MQVRHAERCSEATFADGSCRFGLKVLGSARGPVHFERQAFDSEVPVGGVRVSQMGGSYALIAGACELRAAVNDTFHLSVYGWDGINDIAIVAYPIKTISEPLCRVDASAAAAAASAAASKKHAATLQGHHTALSADPLLRGSVARVAPSARQSHASAFLPIDRRRSGEKTTTTPTA